MPRKKLGPRLATIESAIQQCIDEGHTDNSIELWDCCCDHGYLGRNFINHPQLQAIHFVDCVASIIKRLNEKLQTLANIKQADKIHTHVCSAADIALDANACHIIVLAGIGGLTLLELIDTIYQNHQANTNVKPIILALCPNRHSYAVRQYLRRQDFALINEQFIYENGQPHEIIMVKSPSHTAKQSNPSPVTSTGNFWQPSNEQQAQYISTLMQHYQNQLRSCAADDKEAIESIIYDYQAIEHTFLAES